MSLLAMIADELEIPFIPRDRKVWFLRTKGGKYYFDFKYNGFIALGWDRLSPGSLSLSCVSHYTVFKVRFVLFWARELFYQKKSRITSSIISVY